MFSMLNLQSFCSMSECSLCEIANIKLFKNKRSNDIKKNLFMNEMNCGI